MKGSVKQICQGGSVKQICPKKKSWCLGSEPMSVIGSIKQLIVGRRKFGCLGSEQMSMEESVKQIYVGRRKVVEIEDMPLVRFVE